VQSAARIPSPITEVSEADPLLGSEIPERGKRPMRSFSNAILNFLRARMGPTPRIAVHARPHRGRCITAINHARQQRQPVFQNVALKHGVAGSSS